METNIKWKIKFIMTVILKNEDFKWETESYLWSRRILILNNIHMQICKYIF